jgi:hypothetical protein
MKTKYFIYHIPGVKIGVTQNPEYRITKRQGFTEYEILEEHTNVKVVSERERELQKQYGYKIDNILYWKTLRWQKKQVSPEARKKAVNNRKVSFKEIAKTVDWEERNKKTDYKTIMANVDWEARNAKINYASRNAKISATKKLKNELRKSNNRRNKVVIE